MYILSSLRGLLDSFVGMRYVIISYFCNSPFANNYVFLCISLIFLCFFPSLAIPYSVLCCMSLSSFGAVFLSGCAAYSLEFALEPMAAFNALHGSVFCPGTHGFGSDHFPPPPPAVITHPYHYDSNARGEVRERERERETQTRDRVREREREAKRERERERERERRSQ